MKTLLIISGILGALLSIRAATIPPAKAAAGLQDRHSPKSEVNSDTAVAPGSAALQPQARFGFCPNGWLSYGASCYYLSNIPETWGNAERFCADFQSNLASVHSIWEYNFLQRMVQTGGHSFAWLGGYYFERNWRWEDGSLFDFHNGELISNTYRYKCLQLNTQASTGWSNHGCDMLFPFVCQRRLSC